MDGVTSFIARLYDDSYFHGAFHLRDLLYLAYAQFFSGSTAWPRKTGRHTRAAPSSSRVAWSEDRPP